MRRLFSSFCKRTDGAIAVEFALVAPIMVAMFFGVTELAQGLGAKGDVTNLASTGADLIAQESSVSPSDMTNVFAALTDMLYPYPTSAVQITLTSVLDNGTSSGGKVDWSCTRNGTARSKNSIYTFPAAAQGVITPGSGGSVIMAEVVYPYGSSTTVMLGQTINMTSTFYSKPRRVAQIPLASTCS